jgi:hypothetical protein
MPGTAVPTAPKPVLADALVIGDGWLVDADGQTEVGARVDGQPVWFSVPSNREPALRGDPFLAVTLLPAMRSGRPIHVHSSLPVSPTLLQNLGRLQSIFRLWFPWARPVRIVAESIEPSPSATGVGSLFSGGVDSSYTLLSGAGRIDHLLFVDRVDTGKAFSRESYEISLPSHARTAEEFGASLMLCSTNAKEFGHRHGLDWDYVIGSGLAALAMVARLTELRFPSSSPWSDLRPFGTHPVTDPLWGTETLTVVHDGTDLRRIEKLVHVLGDSRLRDRLRVCMQGRLQNCGQCEKCLRTMAGIRAIGGRSSSLPPLQDLTQILKVVIRTEGILLDWAELLTPEVARADPELFRALERRFRRQRVRDALRALDLALVGGFVRRHVSALSRNQ